MADQDWIQAVSGKCDACFKVRENATTSPVNGNSSSSNSRGPTAVGTAVAP